MNIEYIDVFNCSLSEFLKKHDLKLVVKKDGESEYTVYIVSDRGNIPIRFLITDVNDVDDDPNFVPYIQDYKENGSDPIETIDRYLQIMRNSCEIEISYLNLKESVTINASNVNLSDTVLFRLNKLLVSINLLKKLKKKNLFFGQHKCNVMKFVFITYMTITLFHEFAGRHWTRF